jgi:DNA replication protein DnaC
MREINKQIIENIMTEYNKKRLRAAQEADKKREKLYAKIPRLSEIDKQIKLFSINLSKLFLSAPEDLEAQIGRLKKQVEDLKSERLLI